MPQRPVASIVNFTIMKHIFLILLSLVSAGLAADKDRSTDTIILDEIAVKNLRLETVEVVETHFEESVFALGKIEVLPGKRAIVSSRIPGRALEVNLHPDHAIKEGDPAVVIESRQPGDPPPHVTISANLTGLVSAVHVKPGEPVTPDKILAEIVDLKTVYAIARVPQHVAGQVKPGLKARINVAAVPNQIFETQIEHIGAEADAETGTIEAAFHVDNPDLLLRPGMRAEFSIVTNTRHGVWTVPREAVQGDASNRFVYVADYELKNAFVKTPVRLGAQNDRFVEITGGLLPGDQVVTRGAYALAFAGKGSVSLKEALDAAHGHPHNEDGSEMSKEQASAKGHDGGHRHGGLWGISLVTLFFAVTTILLLVILILRRRSALVS